MHFSCTLNNESACLFYDVGKVFSITCFKHFGFIELFFLNSNFNNLFESSSIKDFLVNSLVDSLFYNLGSIFLTTYFKHFVFMELFDLNSNPNNLFEILLIKNIFVDSSVSFLVASTIKFYLI